MNQGQFQIIYDGPALQTNELNVKDLAPALLAVGDMLEEANRVIYGEKSKVYVNVKGSFKTGSFQVDFTTTQAFLDNIVEIFNNQPPTVQILTLLGIAKYTVDGIEATTKIGDVVIKGVLQLILWVKNHSIIRVTKTKDGNTSIIELDTGETAEVDNSVINLFRNIKIRNSFEIIVNKFLSQEGINYFATGYNKALTEVKKEQKDYFRSPESGEKMVEDQIIDATLQAVTVSFEEGYKWRFTDGETQFTASVRDQNFIEQIQNYKVSFNKGDALKVKLHKKVLLTDKGLKPEYTVLEIIEHYQVGRQIELPFTDDPPQQ